MSDTADLFSAQGVSEIADWAAAECDRQRSGELSVGWMVTGWLYAYQLRTATPTEDDIIYLAHLVEPRLNDGTGYRRPGVAPNGQRYSGNVRVGRDVKCPWEEVPHRMTWLVSFLTDPDATVDPAEWYRQYEEIHPLPDGNGRTGSILYNWLGGTLPHPKAPPDFWAGR
jgi:hypothetical protein